MKRLADRFGESARRCGSFAQLRRLVTEVSGELGFDYFALLHHASLRSPRTGFIRLDNYPAGWVAELVGRGWLSHDPVHLASRRASTGFAWTELELLIRVGREQRQILERSREFGLGAGVTVPVNVPGEPSGSCSFAVRAGIALPRERLLCAELIGAHAFGAARRLANYPSRAQRPRLSRREVQCLRLVAGGKTDWEIAVILGISAETARQYVKRARRAYDAVTRAQLVTFGLRDDWFAFDEALDLRHPRQ